jgi:site-specific DNA-methyltransferase (adenine-specific)
MLDMVNFKDNEFDLAIVDPPYGIGISNAEQIGTSVKHKIKDWDNNIPTQEYFDELKRISTNQIIWGVNYFDGFKLNGGRIIWNKLGTHIGRRENPPTFSDCEIAYCSIGLNVKMFSYTYIGNVQGNNYQILWNKTNRIHPTQKPIALYRWLLQNYAKPNDTILDTHVGSGSSIIACIEEGFHIIGYEIDKDYYEAAQKRIKLYESQLKLAL